MLGDALSTPVRTTDAAVTLLIGGLLALLAALGPLGVGLSLALGPVALLGLPVAALPALVLRGYYVRVAAAGFREEPAAPSLVGWGGLLRDGVKSALLTLGYLLPGLVVVVAGLAALVALAPDTASTAATDPSAVDPTPAESARALAALAVVLVGGLLLAAYGLVYLYLRPAALVVLATSGRLRTAFAPGEVRRVAGSTDFAVGWLLAALTLVVGGLVALPLSVVLVGFVGVVYLQTVAHWLYGRGAARGRRAGDPAGADDSPSVGTAAGHAGSGAPGDDPRPTLAGGVSAAVQTGRTVALAPAASPGRGSDGDETGRNEHPTDAEAESGAADDTDADAEAESGATDDTDAEADEGGEDATGAGTAGPDAEAGGGETPDAEADAGGEAAGDTDAADERSAAGRNSSTEDPFRWGETREE